MSVNFGLLDRAKQGTTTTGTGTVALNGGRTAPYQLISDAGAVSGFQYPYLLEDGGDSEWGFSTVTNTGGAWTLSRDTVIGSIIGGVSGTSKLNLSGAATVAIVWNSLTQPTVRYDEVVLAESSLTQYWKLNEAAGSTSFANSKGSTALTISADTNGNVEAGVKGTIADGKSAVLFHGNPASKTDGIINIPSGASLFPASGDYSIEMILGFEGQYYGSLDSFFCMGSPGGGSGGDLQLYIRNDNWPQHDKIWASISGGVDNWQPNAPARLGRGTHLVITANATANVTTIWTNGNRNLTTVAAVARQSAAGGMGTYMPTRDGNTYPYAGKISKLAVYNAVLTTAQIRAHADAAGLL